MSCCRSFGEPSRRALDARGFTLLEAMVGQTIGLIVISGVLALLVPMIKNFSDQESAIEAQIRLRQASQVILRDLQGIGGADGKAGSLFTLVADGGSNGSDHFRAFKRAQGVCSGQVDPGVLPVSGSPGVNVNIVKNGNTCPMQNSGNCTPSLLNGRRLLLSGPGGAIALTVSNANASSCKIQFNPSANSGAVAEFNATYGTSHSNINQVLNAVGAPASVIAGSTFEYRISREALQRRVDDGAWVTVLEGVYDMQVMRAFDLDEDGVIDANEWDTDGTLEDASASNFFAAKIGLVTYGNVQGALETRPPALMGNRSLSSAPMKRRYRASYILAAARNR